MFFNLTTNEHHPLLGTVRAIFGLREVGLETEDFILVFASDDVDTLLCLGLHSVNTSVPPRRAKQARHCGAAEIRPR
jgi:hypothetical protein